MTPGLRWKQLLFLSLRQIEAVLVVLEKAAMPAVLEGHGSASMDLAAVLVVVAAAVAAHS